ncbi:MAG: MSCRAMM family protein [Thermomicrobiales bacterium]
MRRLLARVLPLLLMIGPCFLLIMSPLAVLATRSQAGGVTVYLQPVNMADGRSVTDACFVIVNASNEGCDQNGDGYISFEGIAPGAYVVSETRKAAGYLPAGDVTINVSPNPKEQTFQIGMIQQSSGTPASVDISLVPTDVRTGVALPGACFIIANVSNEGCDENNDGQVTFDGIPVGTYLVTQTRAPSGYKVEPAQWVVIERNGPIIFLQGSKNSTGSSSTKRVHVSIVTRAPADGKLLTGTCYVIQNASIEGCDENGDGQVDFADVAPGEYTLTQTSTPRGFPAVADFAILITNDPTQSFIVKQAKRQHDARHRNVSIVLEDKDTGLRISGGNACVQIIGASNRGCDENGDGQIDFLDIPFGDHQLRITSMPQGYSGEYTRYQLTIDANAPYSIVTLYLPLIAR